MTRMKSLAVDKNDRNQLKWSRFGNMGACVASEYYQNCPYFFTREGSTVPMVGWFRGKSAFLIASGPSFKDVNKDLLSKPGVWTIATNNAIASFRTNASVVVDEPARFTMSMWLDPTIMKFVPTSLMERPLWDNRYLPNQGGQQWELSKMVLGDCPNVIGYRRNEKFNPERFLYEDTINWGNHKKWGGGRSVLLATMRILFLLGFRKVYLLGVDFEMNENKKYHFDEERKPGAIRGNTSTYRKMMSWFKELQPYFLAEKFIVKNCNPESKLTAFPFMPFSDAIAEATEEIGDTTMERLSGLYASIDDKKAQAMPQETAQGHTPSPTLEFAEQHKPAATLEQTTIIKHNSVNNANIGSALDREIKKKLTQNEPQNKPKNESQNKPVFGSYAENIPSPNPVQITVDEEFRPIGKPVRLENVKM
jgi:hypothetical protein